MIKIELQFLNIGIKINPLCFYKGGYILIFLF